jgi:hypothetical protein
VLELKVYDEDREVVLQFEHSLLSLSKWEEKHKKPFLASTSKKHEEMIDYFQEMLLTPGESPTIVYRLSPEQMDQLTDYINESRTASSVPKDTTSTGGVIEIVTSELIYYWLVALEIPFHPVETWHISRLMMLIQITNFKKQPPKKRNPKEALMDWATLNQRNKERFGTTG